ncbi:hypothetical protein BRD17_01135 [Halobacteriales archaeon SW_7_68_16]|nr:MAG: hypothetical protein BRD17_01135 [Halobacteriales archaeon SW_7_68_16]
MWVGAAVAGLSVPTLAGIGVAGFLFGSRVGQFLAAVLLVAGVPVLASVVARALGLFERNAGDRRCGTGDTARFAVAAVVVVGVLVGVAGVAGGADALVERELFTSPQTAFEFTYSPVTDTRGVLTVRHDGGDAVRADRLYVTGEGVAPVAGTDQGTGVWAGEAAPRPDERYVLPGNETTVGVTPGCDVRLVYRRTDATGDATTLAAYECGDD